MGKHLLLMGAGHAHLTVLQKISEIVDKGHVVTVVGPGEHHYYSGMGPGMLGGYYAPEHIRFPVKRLTEKGGGTFLLDRVVELKPDERKVVLESGGCVEYDAASCNLGSVVPALGEGEAKKGEAIYPVKPIENLLSGRRRILGLVHGGGSRIIVLGGGPAAVEVAGNAWRAARQCLQAKGGKMPAIRILAGRGLLRRYPDKVAKLARESLENRDIEINEDGYVERIDTEGVTLENGQFHRAEAVFVALGTKPPALFRDAGLPVGPDGGLSVNEYLQCVDHPELFGGGDCIHFKPRPIDRVGVHAVKQNPILYRNLMAVLEGGGLEEFEPQSKYMLIFNLGDGTGLLWRGGFACRNRPSFWLKNWIDKRFIREYQP